MNAPINIEVKYLPIQKWIKVPNGDISNLTNVCRHNVLLCACIRSSAQRHVVIVMTVSTRALRMPNYHPLTLT